MKKLTFDEAMDRINDERPLSSSEVLASALSRQLWVAEWHVPGCMSESRSYCETKRDAVDAALSFASGEDAAPRGMKTALVKYGRFDSESEMFGTCINTVQRMTLADII